MKLLKLYIEILRSDVEFFRQHNSLTHHTMESFFSLSEHLNYMQLKIFHNFGTPSVRDLLGRGHF
jgi:hypothetical protein